MVAVFYISAAIAAAATILVILQRNAVHALLYLILSLLAVAVIFYTLGAPFVAALEVVVYAGAIMVLFVFVVMMLNVGAPAGAEREAVLRPRAWIVPAVLALVLLAELVAVLAGARPGAVPTLPGAPAGAAPAPVAPREVSLSLFGPYLLGVELASMLLLAGLVGAYHLGRRSGAESSLPEKEVRDAAAPR